MAVKVFCSHRGVDKPEVEAFARRLRDSGIDAWFDKWEIAPGDDIVARMNAGLDENEVGLVFFSNKEHNGPWFRAEVATLTFGMIENGKRLIPVMIDADAPLPPFLRPRARRGIDEFDAIVDAIKGIHRKPPLGPETPATAVHRFVVQLDAAKTAAGCIDVVARLDESLPTPDDMLNTAEEVTPEQESARQRLNDEEQGKNGGVKNAWNQDVSILADIWRKQGIDDGIIEVVTHEAEPAQQLSAVALMTWVTRGFKDNDGEVIIPKRMIRAYGDGAPKLIATAYKLAVDRGLVAPATLGSTYAKLRQDIEAALDTSKKDAKIIWDNMTPVAKGMFRGTLASDKSDPIKALVQVGCDLCKIANGGEIGDAEMDALHNWFGPRKNDVLDHFYEEKKVDPSLNEPSVKQTGSDDTDLQHQERSGLSDDAAMGDSDWNSPLRLGTDNPFLDVTSSHKYVRYSKANEYFDLRDPIHVGSWEQRRKEKLTAEEGEATQRSVQQVGMVDRELEKAAEASGRALTDEEVKAIYERLALEHDKISPPAALPEDAGSGLKAAQPEAVADYERRVRESVVRLNRRFKVMRVKSEELAKPGVNFSKLDVSDIHQSSRDLRGPSATIQHGVLLFENGNKKPYVTSAAAILRLVHRVNDGSAESFTEYGGDAHSLHERLMTGMSSMLNADPKFTGRVGFIKYAGAEPTWLKKLDQLPDDFVFGKKEGRPLTVREAMVQQAEARAKLDAKAKDFTGNDKPYTGTEYRDVPQSAKAKAFSLGKLSTNFNTESKLTKDDRREIMAATSEFWEAIKGTDAEAITASTEAVEGLFRKYKPKHVKELSDTWSPDNDKTPSENTAFAGQDQGDMLLREDDPSKIGPDNPIHRDERGFLKTDNATMKAANMGSSGCTVKGKAEPGAATKAVSESRLDYETAVLRLGRSTGIDTSAGTRILDREILADGKVIGAVTYERRGQELIAIHRLRLSKAAKNALIDNRVVDQLLQGKNGDVHITGVTDDNRDFWEGYGIDAKGFIRGGSQSVAAGEAGRGRPFENTSGRGRAAATSSGRGLASGVRPVQRGDHVNDNAVERGLG